MPFITAHCVTPALPHPTYWVLHANRQESTHERVEKTGRRGKNLPRRGRNFPRRGRFFPRHLFPAGRLRGRTGCYVKNITSYVKKITSYVNFFT